MTDINTSINVVVRNRDIVLFKDKVKSVTSYNERGVFDILPKHENFISLVKNNVIIHKTNNENHEIKIDNGVVRVYENNVYFYINFENQP